MLDGLLDHFKQADVEQPYLYAHDWVDNYEKGSDPRIPVNASGVSLAHVHATKCGCVGNEDESLMNKPGQFCISKILVDFLDRNHEKVRKAQRKRKENFVSNYNLISKEAYKRFT